jgi:cell division protein FtsL
MVIKNLVLENKEQKIFWFLVMTNILLMASFIFLVYCSLLNMQIRKNIEEKISSVETKIYAQTSEYLLSSTQIDINLAHSLGFREAGREAIFAVRGRPVATRPVGIE